jgi:P pilus assembly chaperone PapD
MDTLIKSAIVILLVGILLIFPSNSVQAQGGIKVWPTKVDMTISEGEQAERVINVQNEGGETIGVRAYVMDFTVDKDNEFIFSEPGHESYSASKWLGVNNNEFELAPGESREVEVVIAAPNDIEPGGHYAALFFETAPSVSEEGVSISTRIPSLFYITVPGVTDADIVTSAEIVSLTLPGFVEKGPVEVRIGVHNMGNVHLTIAAKAYFSDLFGKNSELDLGQITVLPDSEGTLTGSWQEAPFIGRVKTSAVIGYLDQYGDLVNKSQRGGFWVAPWKHLVAIVAVVGSLIALAVLFHKRYRFRVERRSGRRSTS